MDDKRRLFKQIFIAVIYLAIFTGIGTGIYFWVRPTPTPPAPSAPTIYPIEVIWAQAFDSGNNTYSVGAKIRNPNLLFGSDFFTYNFYLYDENGALLGTAADQSFIWPGESKYLILGGIDLLRSPVKIELTIGEPKWHEVKNFEGVDLTVSNISYGKAKAGSGKFFTVDFTASNNTSYDLNKVFISAVIFDKGDKPITINSTIFENLKSKEHRQYSIPWFSAFSGSPNRIDLSISTNLWERPELLGL
jgi:hypothetical protein